MRVPWFSRRISTTPPASRGQLPAPRRSDEDVRLALSLIPRYRVFIAGTLDELRPTGSIAICPRELAEHYCETLRRMGVPARMELV